MDREAIIERIAKESHDGFRKGTNITEWEHLFKAVREGVKKDVGICLDAAGFFDLLEAAEPIAARRGTGSKAARDDYMVAVPDSELWALYAAIAKAKGDTP